MSVGLAVLDANHIFVAGRTSLTVGSRATVFLLGPTGIVRSFSNEFVSGLSGTDDVVMNSASFLALDRTRRQLYQLPQNVYEIRVFDLEGNLKRTITPPSQYRIRVPKLHHYPDGGVGLDPNDILSDIAVLPDGGIAVMGQPLERSEVQGQKTSVFYSRFVDVYDADGSFKSRLAGDQLRFNGGANFLTFDGATGKPYFKTENSVTEAQLR